MPRGAARVIELLVLKAMSGKHTHLDALKSYLDGGRPTDLSRRYGVSKHQIRGLAQRIRDAAGSPVHGETVARMFIEHVLSIPCYIDIEIPACRICRTLLIDIYPEDHLLKKHRDIVRKWVLWTVKRYRGDA